MPTISGVIATLNSASRIEYTLQSLAPHVDELLVFVDDASTDNTAEVAARYASKVIPLPHMGMQECHFKAMHEASSGDFVLRLDDDESLARFDRDQAFKLIEEHNLSNVGFVRRWLIKPGDRYIKTEPWFPDYQFRLLRNDENLVFPNEIHGPMRSTGATGVTQDFIINHHDFVFNSREQREAKIQRYAQTVNPLAHYYRYEDRLEEITISYL